MSRKSNLYHLTASAIILSGLGSGILVAEEKKEVFNLQPVKKMNKCYWLEHMVPDEGLCGAKMSPDTQALVEEAKKGNNRAALRLGQLYSSGSWGVRQDSAKAIKWYTHAAELGNHLSQIRIAQAYEFGRMGAPVDYEQAIKYYSMATAKGGNADL